MCPPAISPATTSATSSPGSASGPSPCDGPGGPTTGLSGPGRAPASPSARQAAEVGLLTTDTCGPRGSGSSRSDALSRSLASRLDLLPACYGSTLYRLVWKDWVTPSGRWMSRLRASAPRTSGSASGGWVSPKAGDYRPGHLSRAYRHQDLYDQSKLAGWPTPTKGNADGSQIGKTLSSICRLELTAQMAGWATPASRDYRTPNHQTYAERGGGPKGEQLQNQAAHLIPGASLNGSTASTGSAGLLNPEFSRWLQGIPATWPACAPTATRSTRSSRRISSAP